MGRKGFEGKKLEAVKKGSLIAFMTQTKIIAEVEK